MDNRIFRNRKTGTKRMHGMTFINMIDPFRQIQIISPQFGRRERTANGLSFYRFIK